MLSAQTLSTAYETRSFTQNPLGSAGRKTVLDFVTDSEIEMQSYVDREACPMRLIVANQAGAPWSWYLV